MARVRTLVPTGLCRWCHRTRRGRWVTRVPTSIRPRSCKRWHPSGCCRGPPSWRSGQQYVTAALARLGAGTVLLARAHAGGDAGAVLKLDRHDAAENGAFDRACDPALMREPEISRAEQKRADAGAEQERREIEGQSPAGDAGSGPSRPASAKAAPARRQARPARRTRCAGECRSSSPELMPRHRDAAPR